MKSREIAAGYDEKYLVCALVYAVGGMSLGLYMAASRNHAQFITHAHALLVGFVVSLLYALIHRLWLANTTSRIARPQFLAHQTGAATMVVGLFELHDPSVPMRVLEPVLAVASTAVLAGAALMLLLVVRNWVSRGDRRLVSAGDWSG